MTDWPKRLPQHKPFKCIAAWHLRRSGALLSLYNLIGSITSGGNGYYFSTIAHATRYFYPEVADNPELFKSKYEVTRRNFQVLRKMGWLKMREDGDHDFVTHEEWEKAHPGKCNKRELLPWQIETDPLVAKLFQISGGKLKLMENYVVGLRKVATDQELISGYTDAMAKAASLRAQGQYEGTSARVMMKKVYDYYKLRTQRRKVAEANANSKVEITT